MANDVELLRLYAEEKSDPAFRELVQIYLATVYSAALRRVGGDTHAAQDVSQQVFAALAKRAPYLAIDVDLAGWLYGTTRNVAADHVKKERRRKNREAEAQAMQPQISETEVAHDWEELKPILDGEIDKLGARDRQAILLRFFAQRPFAEIGNALGVSTDAARRRVDRALERLHRSLNRHGAAPTFAAMTALLSEKVIGAAPAGLHASVTSTALVSTATAMSSALGYLHIMATAKTSLAIAASALVAISFIGYRESRLAKNFEVELATENGRVSALQRSLAETRREVARVESDATRSTQLTERTITRAEVVPPPSAGQTPEAMTEAGNAFMAKYPETRAALLTMRRASIAGRFHRLFQELALTPAQIETFEALASAASNSNRWTAMFNGMPPMHLTLNGPAPGEDIGAQLGQLLGATGYQRYLDYAGAETAQSLTQQLARDLYLTPTPLSGTQADALVRTIRENTAPGSSSQLDWKSVVANAGAFLSQPQLEWLRGMEAESTFRSAMTVALNAARQQTPNAPSP